uniref:ATP synthase F0 subunit 8 n=1 Tax=Hylaeus dilatatus TaxID=1542591 RepID=A0A0S2LT63_9HYME|nr:ATP synthase F0 subunit 8 [Hylaeus dilatatus]AJG02941.1 ATP synthase F0 subunit 8 [Hylaeus dilatatus]ALO64644.1 ATP synthase F0 subunit 8 [Hylaeus dilatatus]
MPQMMPMNWLMMYTFCMSTTIIIIIIIFFTNIYPFTLKNMNPNNIYMNWKWKW